MAEMAVIRDALQEIAEGGRVAVSRKSFELTIGGSPYVIGFPCAFTVRVQNGMGENLTWMGRDMNLNCVKDVHPDVVENGKKFLLFDNFGDSYITLSPTSIVSHPNYKMLKDYIVVFEPAEDLFGEEDLRLITFEIKEQESIDEIKGYLDKGELPTVIKLKGTFEALDREIPLTYTMIKVDGLGARLGKEENQPPLNVEALREYLNNC